MGARLERLRGGILALVTIVVALESCSKGPVQPSPPPASAPPISSPPIGRPLAFVSTRDGTRNIYVADDSGIRRLAPGDRPAWSPDGSRIAFNGASGEGVFVMNVDGTSERYLARGGNPDWSPDGTRIIFNDADEQGIFVMNADGSGVVRLVDSRVVRTPTGRDCGLYWPAWSPDGQRIAFLCATYEDVWQIHIANADGSNTRRLLESTTNFFVQSDATWSPNGSEIAFDAAPYRIDAVNVDGSNLRTVVNNGFWADWSADGRFAFTRRTGPGPTPFGGFETRIFVATEGGAQLQLIPDVIYPAVALYGDSQPEWAP
jgi:Tol biopolymer transport system component